MKKVAALAFLGFLFAGPGLLLAQELCLTYDVKTTQVTEAKKGKPEEKVVPSRITVALGNGYFYISDANGKTIYDFKKRRTLYVDEPTKTYSDVSLFIGIGSRFMEFQNRLYLREVLRKASGKSKKEKPPFEDLFDIESALAIEKPGAPEVRITETGQEEHYQYKSGERVVAECRLSKQVLDPAQKALFEKYLIYGCSLHPQVRRKMAAKSKVPESLKYTYKDAGSTMTVEMTLTKTSAEPRDAYRIPLGYQKTYGPPGEELTAVLTSVWEKTNSVRRMTKEDFRKAIDGFIETGNYFDAVLAAVECSLQTDEDLVSSTMNSAAAQGGVTDKRIRIFIQNTNAKDQGAAKKAIGALGSIKRKGLAHGHVIDIMIAEGKMMTGDLGGAKMLFIKVLKVNPYLTGVYKDLGDLLNISYRAATAWQCWDTARFLCPGHKLLKPVDEYEKSLEKNFPDFFLK